MAMSITISIALDEAGTYTPAEAAVIHALQQDAVAHAAPAASPEPVVTVTNPTTAEEVPAEPEKPKRTRRPKATPAPEAEESTTPAVLDTTLDEVPDEQAIADQEAAGVEAAKQAEAATDVTIEAAVALATELIGNGEKAKVKAALDALGVGRVTELKDNAEALADFIVRLS